MTEILSDPNGRRFRLDRTRMIQALLLCCHVAIICVSIVEVADFFHPMGYVMFDARGAHLTAACAAAFAVLSIVFLISPFSFGYFLGFYFYTLICGYLWLLQFSRLNYDHRAAGISIFVSALAFLAPSLFIKSPLRQRFALSESSLHVVLYGILAVGAAVVAFGAAYNFQLAAFSDINALRDQIRFPIALSYAIGALSGALLPFAFACFLALRRYWLAAMALLLLLLFYPVTLTKLTLAAPLWLIFLWLLCRYCDAKTSVILSLLLPALAGVILILLFNARILQGYWVVNYFGAVNFRMLTVPSMALDYYNEFFATHPNTWFCQINVMKTLVPCPYAKALWTIMADEYHLGNLNASLFATEGIASVGLMLAPFSAFACGLVIALGNRGTAGLPPQFILLSSAVLMQVFLNVPLTITLLTNGGVLLFLLWYVTPRTIFDRQ
jgi:hypothetical protein